MNADNSNAKASSTKIRSAFILVDPWLLVLLISERASGFCAFSIAKP
jgi:hypothetical protein